MMATEATFTVPADRFPLGTVFDELPGVTVKLERIIPTQDVIVPYFWVCGTTADGVEGSFADHPGVHHIRAVDSVGDQHLLRVEWTLEWLYLFVAMVENARSSVDSYLDTLDTAFIDPADEVQPPPDLERVRDEQIRTAADGEFESALDELSICRRKLRGVVRADAWYWPTLEERSGRHSKNDCGRHSRSDCVFQS